MALCFVPPAQPKNVLRGCRDSAQRAAPGLVCITEIGGRLVPMCPGGAAAAV